LFGLVSLLYFINFAIFDLRLLYTAWRMQNTRYFNDPILIRKKLVQFYFIFYISMFVSIFYINYFYFDKLWIFISISLMWIPQIIKNTYTNNRTSLPVLSILIITLNRMIIPVYKI
jgi:hypothetical protein